MKNVKVVLTNGTEQVIKCKHYYKTKTQGFLFVLENSTKNFTLKEVKEIIEPFKLPSGIKIDR